MKVVSPDHLKIVLLGDEEANKKNLVNQIADYVKASSRCKLLIDGRGSGPSTLKFAASTSHGKETIDIIETPGQEYFKNMLSSFCQLSKGAIFVFSSNYRDTFDNLVDYINILNDSAGYACTKTIVCNDCDRSSARAVTEKEARQLAERFFCNYFEVSQKSSENVRIIEKIVMQVADPNPVSKASNDNKNFISSPRKNMALRNNPTNYELKQQIEVRDSLIKNLMFRINGRSTKSSPYFDPIAPQNAAATPDNKNKQQQQKRNANPLSPTNQMQTPLSARVIKRPPAGRIPSLPLPNLSSSPQAPSSARDSEHAAYSELQALLENSRHSQNGSDNEYATSQTKNNINQKHQHSLSDAVNNKKYLPNQANKEDEPLIDTEVPIGVPHLNLIPVTNTVDLMENENPEIKKTKVGDFQDGNGFQIRINLKEGGSTDKSSFSSHNKSHNKNKKYNNDDGYDYDYDEEIIKLNKDVPKSSFDFTLLVDRLYEHQEKSNRKLTDFMRKVSRKVKMIENRYNSCKQSLSKYNDKVQLKLEQKEKELTEFIQSQALQKEKELNDKMKENEERKENLHKETLSKITQTQSQLQDSDQQQNDKEKERIIREKIEEIGRKMRNQIEETKEEMEKRIKENRFEEMKEKVKGLEEWVESLSEEVYEKEEEIEILQKRLSRLSIFEDKKSLPRIEKIVPRVGVGIRDKTRLESESKEVEMKLAAVEDEENVDEENVDEENVDEENEEDEEDILTSRKKTKVDQLNEEVFFMTELRRLLAESEAAAAASSSSKVKGGDNKE